ncbi:MAG: 4-hydroxy-tetrahydrodipicolinate synthase [uncultured Rubrobacteraceae bacterium]|uniref:4-hydroxy-tetrahydrodipicolinate synthase n=1 Tax=uncultured Rubrobacteraceae bacterium TaxID=349277 RepID=A0A6J4PDZ3_9ACTN|nr:MAG: 4-hydroxy-tetrahydrodipicolinate synthase [uncultured Rubrobacteraceae bacterium]
MFSGAFTALVTPFRNGEVDVEALENLVEFQIGQGIHGLVPCGTTGETPSMSEEEDRLVIGTVVRVTNGRVPVVAGTGSNSTDMAIKYTRMAEEEGADGSLQVAPYYTKPTQEGLYRHFAAIAESTSLPLVLYNIPGRTSVTISAETTARLAELPNIVGTKEATHSMDMASDIRRLCGEEFDILSGDDSLTLPLMSLGGRGVISVAANVAPAVVSDMVGALLAGDFERGRELHYDLLPLCRALFVETNPIPVKAAASILGLCSDEMRLPMVPLAGENLDHLRRVMERTNHLLPTPEEV